MPTGFRFELLISLTKSSAFRSKTSNEIFMFSRRWARGGDDILLSTKYSVFLSLDGGICMSFSIRLCVAADFFFGPFLFCPRFSVLSFGRASNVCGPSRCGFRNLGDPGPPETSRTCVSLGGVASLSLVSAIAVSDNADGEFDFERRFRSFVLLGVGLASYSNVEWLFCEGGESSLAF